jgi:hypothetical protein
MVLLMLGIAVGIEVAYASAWKTNGYSVSTLAKFGSPQFLGVSESPRVESQYLTCRFPVLPPSPRHLALGSLLPRRQS